jgi:hypothetical protein
MQLKYYVLQCQHRHDCPNRKAVNKAKIIYRLTPLVQHHAMKSWQHMRTSHTLQDLLHSTEWWTDSFVRKSVHIILDPGASLNMWVKNRLYKVFTDNETWAVSIGPQFLAGLVPQTHTVTARLSAQLPYRYFYLSVSWASFASLWGGDYLFNVCLSLGTGRAGILFRAYRPNSLETLCNFQTL